ncbi:Nn.00g000910.m01.CDS01 [Neocucurbitaria sp. VM-36]
MPLSKQAKELLEEGFLTKPCIRCGEDDHSVSECKGGTKAMRGSLWIILKGADMLAAGNELSKMQRAYNAQNKKGTAQTAASRSVASAPPVTDPVIAPEGFSPVTTTDAAITNPYDSTPTSELPQIEDPALAEEVEIEFPKSMPAPDGSNLRDGHSHRDKAKISGIVGAKFPLRKEFSKPASEVLTNHFEVSWSHDPTFYVYEITDIPSGNKRKTKSIVNTAIRAWDFLKDNEAFFATDYRKTIVAWKNLHQSISCPRKTTTAEGKVLWMPCPIADGDRRIELAFKYHGILNLGRLKDFINPTSRTEDETLPNFNFQLLMDYLNTVISKSLTDELVWISSRKFYFKNSYEQLGESESLCVMRGYDYTIKPAMGKVLLNVNATTSAFYRTITVAEFLKDNTFARNEREKLIRGLRVFIVPDRQLVKDPEDQKHVDHLNERQNRIKTVRGFGKPIGTRDEPKLKFRKSIKLGDKFQQESKDTHVLDHMRAVFGSGQRLDEKLTAVNVGTENNPVWYPQEFLLILPYQLYNNLLPDQLIESMLKCACKKPAEIRARIEAEGLKGLGVVLDNGVQKFAKCNVLTIVPNMLQVDSTKMGQVYVAYRSDGGSTKTPNDKAQWNLSGMIKFLDTPNSNGALDYYMLIDPALEARTVGIYKDAIANQVRNYGIAGRATCVAERTLPTHIKDKTHEELKDGIRKLISQCKTAKPSTKLVVLLLKKRSIATYSAFKDVADRISGLQSVCVTEEKNRNKPPHDRGLLQYFANVMMKVNLKQGGRNHTVCGGSKGEDMLRRTLSKVYPERSTMILGADVTHPGAGSLIGCPSIAALVGSVDLDGGKFLGSMRLQKKSKKEIIDEIETMAEERFRAWDRKYYHAPNVLYYRDGVSDGQFKDLVDTELAHIKKAWKKVWPRTQSGVRLTAVVAVKRHGTRLFPLPNKGDQNGNCPPGTLVDSGITSPFFSEFFLQSHHALKGTAIPTRYFVLENGMKLSDTEIQNLTHKLCFTYVRATMGVSYAPPAYYADRLCERGRQYLRDWFTPNYDSDHYKAYQSLKDRVIQANSKDLADEVAKLLKPPVPEGRRRARKSAAEVKLERDNRIKNDEELAERVLKQAQAYIDAMRAKGCGPWHKDLDETMFWM